MTRARLIVLGASGFLGRNLVSHWNAGGEEVVPVARNPESLTKTQGLQCVPLSQFEEFLDRKDTRDFRSLVINTVAMADIQKCENDLGGAQEANHHFALRMARLCLDRRIPFAHMSTDSLFPNHLLDQAPVYWEPIARPGPATVYAQTKLAAEEGLRQLGWGDCLRVSFVGSSLGTGRGLIRYLAKSLAEKTPIQGYTDNWFNPLHTRQLARYLLEAAVHPQSGFQLTHLGTDTAMTKYDFLKSVLALIGANAEVTPVRRNDLGNAGKTSFDQSLKVNPPFSSQEMLEMSAQSFREELI